MLQCKHLTSLTSMSSARLIAGANGMNREIRWAYKPESMNFDKWVRGQEMLIVSSPVAQRKNFDLYRLIKKAIELHMACALLLQGDGFVSDISPDVIHMAESNSFPLFVMPCTVPLIDLFEELGHTIAYLDHRNEIQNQFLAEIMFGGEQLDPARIHQICQQMHCSEDTLHQPFVIQFQELSEHSKMEALTSLLSDSFQQKQFSVLTACYGSRIVGFSSGQSQEQPLLFEILSEFSQTLLTKEQLSLTICVGEFCEDLTRLPCHFQELCQMNQILVKIGRFNEPVSYSQMSLYRLLLSFEDKTPLSHFRDEILGVLLTYDRENHTQLVETLWKYFQNNCHLQETADCTFTHKNTIKYRLKRIEQLTSRDLDNRFQALELYQALIIHHFL